jgi:hypothetical protein
MIINFVNRNLQIFVQRYLHIFFGNEPIKVLIKISKHIQRSQLLRICIPLDGLDDILLPLKSVLDEASWQLSWSFCFQDLLKLLKVDHSNSIFIDFGKELIQYRTADGNKQGDTLFEFIESQHSILIGVKACEQQLGGISLGVHGFDD